MVANDGTSAICPPPNAQSPTTVLFKRNTGEHAWRRNCDYWIGKGVGENGGRRFVGVLLAGSDPDPFGAFHDYVHARTAHGADRSCNRGGILA